MASRRRWRVFQKLLRRLHLRHKTSAWASGPAGCRCLAEEEQLGKCSAKQSEYYQLYSNIGKLCLAAMYLRRV
jgi:hypothetical protein